MLEIIKKQVRPISQQDENESRKVWKEVTVGLKFNDIDKATGAKQTLEQRQRNEAKERKETGQEWQTKVFFNIFCNNLYNFCLQLFKKCAEDVWMYEKPLRERLAETSNT